MAKIETLSSWDGEEAWRNVLGSSSSRWFAERRSKHWPSTAACRLEKAVVLPEVRPGFRIEKEDRIFTIGSCFARNIENHLGMLGFRVETWNLEIPGFEFHPPHSSVLLNKFTTHSMLNEIRWALDPGARFPEESIVQEPKGGWVDHQVVGEVAAAPRDVVLERRPHIIDCFRKIRDARLVVMTLGLVEAWYDEQVGIYLNRAPGYFTVKKNPGRFSLRLLDAGANRAALEEIHSLLSRFARSDVKILLTVSPVPMSETFTGRDVIVANSYSKSTLRSVAEEFARAHDNVEYYPSYESVILTDRRVAFEEDLQHVSDAIVDINVQRFVDHYAGEGESEERVHNAERHAEERLSRSATNLLGENARLRAEIASLRGRLAATEGNDDAGEASRRQGDLAGETNRLLAENSTLRLRLDFPGVAAAALFRVGQEGALVTASGSPVPVGERLAGVAEIGERSPGGLRISGWAFDRDAPKDALEILVVVDGMVAGRGRTGIKRADVGRAFSLPDSDSGFAIDLSAPEGVDLVARVFALSLSGFVRELQYHPERFRLKDGRKPESPTQGSDVSDGVREAQRTGRQRQSPSA